MNFSLFLNTRGRVPQLKNFLNAVRNTTKNLDEIEVIIRCDIDDLETNDFLTPKNLTPYFSHTIIKGGRPTNLCASYNNMAKKAVGKYLLVMNDDAEIQTKNWDEIALSRIAMFKEENNIKDDIIYGNTSDTSIDKPEGTSYASFPIISKEAVNVLGFFMYEDFVGLGGDSSIIKVYQSINRIVDMSEITIDHVYHNQLYKVTSPDLTASEMRANSYKHEVNPFTFDVSKDVEKLKNYICKNNVEK